MMGLTNNQQKAVECAGKPLFIQAGAGTGKTFTLTKKLGFGLSQESGPLLRSVDSVLTITFTNKAAAELLGRVRAELRSQGLANAALGIDAAWISTIHGMCSAILSAHAIEAGIDPGMGIMAEEDSDALLQAAIDELLGDSRMQALMDAFKPENACRLVAQAAHITSMAPEGFATVSLGPGVSTSARSSVRGLYSSLKAHLESLDSLGVYEGPSDNCAKQTKRLEDAVKVAEQLSQMDELTWNTVDAILSECELPKGGNLKKVFKEDFAEALELIVDVRLLAAVAVSRDCLEAALELGRLASARHKEMKSAQGVRDTDDLLLDTLKLLNEHPHIADEYRERFDAVMVDEFQDTDSMQVAIIRHFCDENLSTLTTVGDAQQSIYGFRGADLETYRNVRSMMNGAGGQEVSLDTNYRSHPDILAFVESIFSKPGFFGDDFLFIGAGEDNARAYPWAPEGAPRVSMMLAAGVKEGRSYTHTADLKVAEAELIAERFQELAQAGAAYGDMAILMSSTKGAAPYLNALRSRGIPCSISGGSDFYLQQEVSTLTSLLRVLELPDDDRPLLELLASPMFDLPDGDLLSLRTVARREIRNPGPGDIRPKISLWDALCYQVDRLPYSSADPMIKAHEVLSNAREMVGTTALHTIVAQCVSQSGWLEELRDEDAAGAAIAANINRFCDILQELEDAQGPGSVMAGEYFKNMLKLASDGTGAKGKPGSMVGLGRNAVTVMTIHASKGLEFPIVAVARYMRSKPKADSSRITSVSQKGSSFLALPPKYGSEGSEDLKARLRELGEEAPLLADVSDEVMYSGASMVFSEEAEAQEEQRLLYVALTRARDMLLLVSSDKSFLAKGAMGKGLFSDVVDAVFPEGFPQGNQTVRIDTGCLVECVTSVVPFNPDSPSGDDDDELPKTKRWHRLVGSEEPVRLRRRLPKNEREIKSYSSLGESKGSGELPVPGLTDTVFQPDTVSQVGSAFHAVAQWIALQSDAERLALSDEGLQRRIASLARRYELDTEGTQRLQDAVSEWLSSQRFHEACGYDQVYPEHGFCVRAGDIALEGFIDLLCLPDDRGKALIVDYKTGESGEEEQLRERYRLQATVYAYAVLETSAANSVEVVFVRPEAGLQEVVFEYAAEELGKLKKEIANA